MAVDGRGCRHRARRPGQRNLDPEACAEETVPAGYRELGHRCWKRGADEEEEGMEGVVEGWRGGWVSSQG